MRMMSRLATMMALVFLGVPVGSCLAGELELTGTYWRVIEIDGQKVAVSSSQREPHLEFHAQGSRVSGSTGCNRLTGGFARDGQSLTFKQLATTKMACPPPLDNQERKFFQALEAVTVAQRRGNRLELKDAAGQVRLLLEAR